MKIEVKQIWDEKMWLVNWHHNLIWAFAELGKNNINNHKNNYNNKNHNNKTTLKTIGL